LNILLIGGSDNLANRLIASFNKEGHRVSVLTGSYHTGKKYNRVFELYNFPYSSNVLTEIFESVAPDLTVCMGIHDSNYRWEDPMKDSMEFITSFMNILNAFSALGRGRFVLLSSDAVYKDSLPHLITEETEPDANDLKGLSLIEAESLCEKYRSVFGADILTIRLSGNYWQPKTLEDVGDPVSRMCLRVLKDGRVSTVSNRSIMLIHNSDAAFFITKLALTDGRKYSVYNISSGVPIALSDLAGVINEAADKILAGTATGSAGDDRADAADNASGKRRAGTDAKSVG
jgi:nucleoside-diphosphate-sugar epimerase